jgi:ABC-type transport system involved in cytochrome bd biosynthesis fused ATPase/permease subunit
LKEITLEIQPGEHIAIVGPSGAGKSSLVGLLLGWNRPSQGRILVDERALDGRRVQALRRETAWVDPAVQLWNRSLYDNLRYGMEQADGQPLAGVIQDADLFGVLERMPDGLKTSLGEGGGLVSGGEGQRVRLGRAMLRSGARLVILDEPFRGLDREKRRNLLVKARQHWETATLLCITHDVSETLNFPRVLVIEEGRIIEDGTPQDLATRPGARYQQLLEAEEQVRQGLWASTDWQRLWIEDGRLTPRTDNFKIPGSPEDPVPTDML